MGQPAAKQGDQINAVDTHIVMVPSPGGPVPTPLPHPFSGIISGNLSSDVKIKLGSTSVKINGKAAARNGDLAETCNDPSDLPVGQVIASGTVSIG
jgi:uncharacterized Zn-binding protein involved in type VI secretion